MGHSILNKVSVVIPAYNAESLIGDTIQSVVNQTHKHWEMLVVDDCSTDSTRSVVNQWVEKDSRIKLISLKSNFGAPAGPRNIGVQEASNDLIAFLDADDIWHPQKLESQLSIMASRNADLVCSQITDFYDEKTIVFSEINAVDSKVISYSSERLRNKIPTSSVIVRREVALKFSFKEERAYRAVEDYDSWLRILESGACCIKVLEPLVYYRKVEGQISGSKFEMLKKVLMVHQAADDVCAIGAFFYTFTHFLGALFMRGIQKKM